MPPKIQKTFFKSFNKFSDEAKLVDFESLIIVKFLFSKIICCRYCSPLNRFKVLNKLLLSNFSVSEIFRIKDKFSLFPTDEKYLFFNCLIALFAFIKSTLIIFCLNF